eukprot:TRINITY_DN4654_c0_g1_i1.p1 TRINITY_DN4654_c0_g1~~TRINITY_DN4654_c0_g1_i1.p1  ORF type:complete len:201 (+),score=51.63 TRINITY_DN4654_c0_g1_i1:44-604(+)
MAVQTVEAKGTGPAAEKLKGIKGAEAPAVASKAGCADVALEGAEESESQDAEETEDSAKKEEAAASSESGKPTTLLQALGDKGNRDVACLFAGFSAALAVIPVLGLVITERLLRSSVQDDSSRWMYSGAVAVVLVNAVLVAYVVWCFAEGFPQSGPLDKAQDTPRDTGEAQGAAEGAVTDETKKQK